MLTLGSVLKGVFRTEFLSNASRLNHVTDFNEFWTKMCTREIICQFMIILLDVSLSADKSRDVSINIPIALLSLPFDHCWTFSLRYKALFGSKTNQYFLFREIPGNLCGDQTEMSSLTVKVTVALFYVTRFHAHVVNIFVFV